MLDNVIPTLRTGRKLLSRAVLCPFGEGVIGAPLAEIQKQNPDTIIGSYPKFENGRFSTELVVRGSDPQKIDAAAAEIDAMIAGLVASGAS
jgi:molybdopterin-biosynthesis enzyme MoeA-like protein